MDQPQAQLSAEDWTRAALEAFGEGGLAAVAVQPLAVKLGVTKGSFYWHFANREALVSAALALWEQTSTERTIELLEAEPDPVVRLRQLFARVTLNAENSRVELGVRAASGNELVATVIRRVEARRLGYTIHLFEQIGFSPTESARRGMLAYAAYIGHSELASRLPGFLPMDEAGGLPAYVESVLGLLLSDRPTSPDDVSPGEPGTPAR